MYFDAEQTYEALYEIEQPRVQRAAGRTGPFLLGGLIGYWLGRQSK